MGWMLRRAIHPIPDNHGPWKGAAANRAIGEERSCEPVEICRIRILGHSTKDTKTPFTETIYDAAALPAVALQPAMAGHLEIF